MRLMLLALCLVLVTGSSARADGPPNVLVILADDLGWGEVGCYGQTKIRTPHIDRIAAEGMRFLEAYSASPVCAPSRCSLLTGLHQGHAFIRNNKEMGGWEEGAREGQLHLPADTRTLGTMLQDLGYTTGVIGKWGLGGPGTSGEPNRQGFDHWYGYLCQRVAHNYYPTHLWRNGARHVLDNPWFAAHQKIGEPHADRSGYDAYAARDFAGDLMANEALEFIRAQRDGPFFLLYATPVPHVALQVPDDSVDAYRGAFDETPYLGQKGYLPHPEPRAAYAGMISRMDRDIGRMLDLLDEMGIADDTIVLVTSDNGPTYAGGVDAAFFESAGPLRGLKGSVFEGGIRVPLIARWPGRIAPGTTSDHPCAFWDVLPTVVELAGGEAPDDVDGISFAPALRGDELAQRRHDVMYWELGRQQALRAGDWKLVQRVNQRNITTTMVFDLARDPGETTDLADARPELRERLVRLARAARTPSAEFPSVFDDAR